MHAKSLQSCLTLCNLIDLARQPPCPWDSPGRNTGVGCPPPEDLPNPGIELESLKFPALAGRFSTTSSTWEAYFTYMLLLLLSRVSRVRLCVTPETAAHQAPPSLGFSRQEHWSGLPFPSPVHESENAQSCLTLSDPMDFSLPGSSVHGIFQARVLEWGAIAVSNFIYIGQSK